jgi:hypothetical protein
MAYASAAFPPDRQGSRGTSRVGCPNGTEGSGRFASAGHRVCGVKRIAYAPPRGRRSRRSWAVM